MGDSLLLLIWFIKLFHIIIVELVCEKKYTLHINMFIVGKIKNRRYFC